MSAAQATTASQTTVFHDAHTKADRSFHSQIVGNIRAGKPPAYLAGMPSVTLKEGLDKSPKGTLAEGRTATGRTIYFGGFVTNELDGTPEGSTQEVAFYFDAGEEGDQGDEPALIRQLMASSLIPQDTDSFAKLGDRAIGVIENAIDEGVLKVSADGKLTLGGLGMPEDEIDETPSPARLGANRLSETDGKGQVVGTETENTDAQPKGQRSAESTTPSTASGGSSTDADTPTAQEGVAIDQEGIPMLGNPRVLPSGGTLHQSEDYKIYISDMPGIPAGQIIEISQNALKEAGLVQPSIGTVQLKFARGQLGLVYPKGSSGVPTVVGVSKDTLDKLAPPGSAGPDTLNQAFQQDKLAHTNGAGYLIEEDAEPTEEASTATAATPVRMKTSSSGAYMAGPNGQQVPILPEALEAAADTEDPSTLTDADLADLRAKGRLAVLSVNGEDRAFGLTQMQLDAAEALTDMRGQQAVEAAYRQGYLGVGGQHLGTVAILQPASDKLYLTGYSDKPRPLDTDHPYLFKPR